MAQLAVCQHIPSSSMSITESASKSINQPTFYFSSNIAPTYAVANENATTTKYYGPNYTEVSSFLGELSTTTWGSFDRDSNSTATDTADPYGQYAWSQVWSQALESLGYYNTTSIYSTTVEPTAIPTESLVLPPQDSYQYADDLKFPESFTFGACDSAVQMEGAFNAEGRTPSVFDVLDLNADDVPSVANEGYYLYKQDIARMAAMGLKRYYFTISWTRILPFGLPGTPVNKQAIDHYDDVINTCLEYGIEPMVSLTHFDSPISFTFGRPIIDFLNNTDTGAGWELGVYSGNVGYLQDYFIDAYVNYGKIVLSHYADRVPIWVAFNEPFDMAGSAKGVKHVIQATALLHEFYHEKLNATGKFGIKLHIPLSVPEDPSNSTHVAAAKRFTELFAESIANPLFLGLPQPDAWDSVFCNDTGVLLSDEELAFVSHRADFFGVDSYEVQTVTPLDDSDFKTCISDGPSNPLFPFCVNTGTKTNNGWLNEAGHIAPASMRELLKYVGSFGAPVILSEFGYLETPEEGDLIWDTDRSNYIRSVLDVILKSIHYDGVNIIGAMYWSIMDDNEFGDYGALMGLMGIDRDTQERYYRKSFFDIMKYVQDRSA